MIKRVDHVSIAVRDLEKAKEFFIDRLGGRELFCAPSDQQGFRWTTIELGASCLLELVDPIGEGFVQRFLRDRGEGVHHVTIQVEDAKKAEAALNAKGVPTFGYGEPHPAWKEFFVHPRDAFGTLLQFAEFDPLAWINSGYVPKAYREFVEPDSAAGKLEVRRVREGDRPAVELRNGDQAVRIEADAVDEVIRLLQDAVRWRALGAPNENGTG